MIRPGDLAPNFKVKIEIDVFSCLMLDVQLFKVFYK